MIWNQNTCGQHPYYETHKQMQRRKVREEVHVIIAEARALEKKLEGKRILPCLNK